MTVEELSPASKGAFIAPFEPRRVLDENTLHEVNLQEQEPYWQGQTPQKSFEEEKAEVHVEIPQVLATTSAQQGPAPAQARKDKGEGDVRLATTLFSAACVLLLASFFISPFLPFSVILGVVSCTAFADAQDLTGALQRAVVNGGITAGREANADAATANTLAAGGGGRKKATKQEIPSWLLEEQAEEATSSRTNRKKKQRLQQRQTAEKGSSSRSSGKQRNKAAANKNIDDWDSIINSIDDGQDQDGLNEEDAALDEALDPAIDQEEEDYDPLYMTKKPYPNKLKQPPKKKKEKKSQQSQSRQAQTQQQQQQQQQKDKRIAQPPTKAIPAVKLVEPSSQQKESKQPQQPVQQPQQPSIQPTKTEEKSTVPSSNQQTDVLVTDKPKSVETPKEEKPIISEKAAPETVPAYKPKVPVAPNSTVSREDKKLEKEEKKQEDKPKEEEKQDVPTEGAPAEPKEPAEIKPTLAKQNATIAVKETEIPAEKHEEDEQEAEAEGEDEQKDAKEPVPIAKKYRIPANGTVITPVVTEKDEKSQPANDTKVDTDKKTEDEPKLEEKPVRKQPDAQEPKQIEKQPDKKTPSPVDVPKPVEQPKQQAQKEDVKGKDHAAAEEEEDEGAEEEQGAAEHEDTEIGQDLHEEDDHASRKDKKKDALVPDAVQHDEKTFKPVPAQPEAPVTLPREPVTPQHAEEAETLVVKKAAKREPQQPVQEQPVQKQQPRTAAAANAPITVVDERQHDNPALAVSNLMMIAGISTLLVCVVLTCIIMRRRRRRQSAAWLKKHGARRAQIGIEFPTPTLSARDTYSKKHDDPVDLEM